MRNRLSFLRIRSDGPFMRQILPAAILVVVAALVASLAAAQPFNNRPGAGPAALVVPGGQQNAALIGPNVAGTAPQGGAANADFDSLIDLIQSTVAVETWAENGGGEADIRPFPGGVFVDAAGTLRSRTRAASATDLVAKRGEAPGAATQKSNARRASPLRYVSLPRLEREIARRQAAREPLDQEMLTLAGLQRVQYVFVYPESGDLVLAGSAGDWFVDPDGRILATETRQPMVRLDDLLVLLRRGPEAAESYFGCSINPRTDALAKTQAFLASSSQRPLEPGQRKKWLGDLRDSVGAQDIEVFGIDPASRAAGVLVEADYHMKLIGMGLAEGVDGVESYLDSLKSATQRAGASSPPAMSVLRWWFTLHYETIASSPSGDAFELVGQGVRVLSENELLAAQGQRVQTGQSEPLNRQFAESFTAHFAELAAKYPVYGELRNVFDLAMAVALIHSEGLVVRGSPDPAPSGSVGRPATTLLQRAGWQPELFVNGEQLRLPNAAVPRQVETVINHHVINRRHIVAGVSGGVMVAPGDVLHEAKTETTGVLSLKRQPAGESWWWDAAE